MSKNSVLKCRTEVEGHPSHEGQNKRRSRPREVPFEESPELNPALTEWDFWMLEALHYYIWYVRSAIRPAAQLKILIHIRGEILPRQSRILIDRYKQRLNDMLTVEAEKRTPILMPILYGRSNRPEFRVYQSLQ